MQHGNLVLRASKLLYCLIEGPLRGRMAAFHHLVFNEVGVPQAGGLRVQALDLMLNEAPVLPFSWKACTVLGIIVA